MSVYARGIRRQERHKSYPVDSATGGAAIRPTSNHKPVTTIYSYLPGRFCGWVRDFFLAGRD